MKHWYDAAMNKVRRPLKPTSRDELQCHDVVILYNLVFDIGKPVNPTQAARDLLKKDFACASANHITNTLEIAPRFKQLLKLRERAVQLGILSSYIEQHAWKAAISWAFHHPQHALSVLSKLQLNRGTKAGVQTSTPPHQKGTTALKEALKLIDDSMAKFQSLEGLQLYSDKQLFSPLYLREAPFVRIGLQPFFATIDGEDIGVDVSLLIHRTGVAILTCGVMFQKPKTIDALIQLKILEEIAVPRFEIAKVLTDVPSTAHDLEQMKLSPTSTRHSSGIKWCEYKAHQPVNLFFIFHLYQDAIIAASDRRSLKKSGNTFSRLRSPDWLAYPIIFIRQTTPKYPTDAALKDHHAQELAGLVLGFSQWKQVKPEKIQEVLKKDLTLTSDYSFYLEASHAVFAHESESRAPTF